MKEKKGKMKGYSKFKSQCGIGNQTFGETLMNSISFQLKNHMNIKMITQSCLATHLDAIILAGSKEDVNDRMTFRQPVF